MHVATSGEPESVPGSAGNLAAQNVLDPKHGPGAQLLQSILSWLSGIMSATQCWETIQTQLLWEVTSGSSGSAASAQQDSNTAGLLNLMVELAEATWLSSLCWAGCMQMQLSAGTPP